MENWLRLGAGLLVSTIGGWFVLWIIVDLLLWPRLGGKPRQATGTHLTWPLGVVERILYTACLVLGRAEWIGVWLVMKTVVHWQPSGGILQGGLGDRECMFAGRNNIWLIGNGLSVAVGYIGAWVALGHPPQQ